MALAFLEQAKFEKDKIEPPTRFTHVVELKSIRNRTDLPCHIRVSGRCS